MSVPNLPDFNGGTLPTSIINAWLSAIRFSLPPFARKQSDETIISNATFQNDDDLFVPVSANAVYDCHLHFIFNSGATPALKTQFTAPAGATMSSWTFFLPNGSGMAIEGVASAAAGVSGITCTGSDQPGDYFGLLVMGGTAGTFQFQWAQNTLTASNTIVRAGSYLSLRQVG